MLTHDMASRQERHSINVGQQLDDAGTFKILERPEAFLVEKVGIQLLLSRLALLLTDPGEKECSLDPINGLPDVCYEWNEFFLHPLTYCNCICSYSKINNVQFWAKFSISRSSGFLALIFVHCFQGHHHTTHIKVHYMTDPFHTSRFVLGRELLPA